MPSAWNMFVKKIYNEGRKQHGKSYKFSQALKDASKRKAEMGINAVKSVGTTISSSIQKVSKRLRGKRNSKKAKCIQKCEQEENDNKKSKRRFKRKGKTIKRTKQSRRKRTKKRK